MNRPLSARPRRGVALAIGLVLAIVLGSFPAEATPAGGGGGGGVVSENEVKAAFLYNFARFVEWPPDYADRGAKRFRIAVLGDDALAFAVAQIVKGKTVGGMPIIVERLYAADGFRECHILFVAASQDHRLAQVFETLGDRPVLTVGETDRFARSGGMIRFEIVEARLRFNINLQAAETPGLSISSRLLGVAATVDGKWSGGR